MSYCMNVSEDCQSVDADTFEISTHCSGCYETLKILCLLPEHGKEVGDDEQPELLIIALSA